MFDPKNQATWDYIGNHPIFTSRKSDIANWSHFPEEYGSLDRYSKFELDWYCGDYFDLELDQRAVVARDVRLLGVGCQKIQERFPDAKYEILVADDCTISAKIKDELFDIIVLPSMPDQSPHYNILTKTMSAFEEIVCHDESELVMEIEAVIDG